MEGIVFPLCSLQSCIIKNTTFQGGEPNTNVGWALAPILY